MKIFSDVQSYKMNSSPEKKQEAIQDFFKKHDVIRQLFAYGPEIYILGTACLKKISSYDVTPKLNWQSAFIMIPIWYLRTKARDCEVSLIDKEIELSKKFPQNGSICKQYLRVHSVQSNQVKISPETTQDPIDSFFKKHNAIRQLFAYGLTVYILGMVYLKRNSSDEFFPLTWKSAPILLPICYLYGAAMGCEASLIIDKIVEKESNFSTKKRPTSQ